MSKFNRWFTDFVDQVDGISVYFVDSANQVFNSDIDGTVLAKYRKSFCDDLRKKYTGCDDFEVTPLSTFDERPHTLYFYDFNKSEMPLEFKFTEQVLTLKSNQIVPKYQVKNQKLGDIKSAVVILSNSTSGDSVAFYQYVFPVSLLGPDKGVLNITTHKTRLVELEQDVLKLNTKFVFMQCPHGYLIENVNVLETYLHFKKVINSRAKNYVVEIEKMDLVEDTKMILDRIDKEPAYAKKLVNAYKNSVVISSGISNEAMIKFAQSKPYYRDYLKPSASGKSFVVDKVVQSKRFIELLNDNFLKSELTKTDYLARSKKMMK